jgi:hypothetical protein
LPETIDAARETKRIPVRSMGVIAALREVQMGRGILLWLLGIPIPIIILLALIWH